MLDAREEEALLKLRRDMLEFIVEELASRAEEGGGPQLSEALTGRIRQEISASVAKAMAEARSAEAADIAQRVVDDLAQRGLLEPAQADETISVTPVPEADPEPPSRARARLAKLRGKAPLILLVFALIALVVVGILYADSVGKVNRLTQDNVRKQYTVEAFQRHFCSRQLRIDDQIRGLSDARVYRDWCAPGRPGRDENPVCNAITRINRLSIAQQCRAWQMSQ